MDSTVLGSLAIVGIALSLLMQWLKGRLDQINTQFVVLGLSLLAGIVYFFLKANTNLLADCLTILATAESVYSYILRYMENTPPSTGATS